MVFEVRLESDEPPSGSVCRREEREDAPPDGNLADCVAFTGWLGLLAALSDLIRRPA